MTTDEYRKVVSAAVRIAMNGPTGDSHTRLIIFIGALEGGLDAYGDATLAGEVRSVCPARVEVQ